MSGVSLFKSQEDFYRRNKATMKTARELTNEAERGSVDLRYAYKLLPPGSKNFYATAWEQTWGDGALMYRAKMVDSKRPVIEKINLDQPETGSLPTSAPKNGLGSEGLICDTLVGDSADYTRTTLIGTRLRNQTAGGLGGAITVGEEAEGSVAGEITDVEEGEEAPMVALADGQYAHGEAAWGPAPGENDSAIDRIVGDMEQIRPASRRSYAPSAAGDTPSVRSRVSRRSYGGSVAGSSAEPESTPSYRSAASRDSRYTDFFSATTRTYRSPPPSVGGASAKTGGKAASTGRRTPVSTSSVASGSTSKSSSRSGGGGKATSKISDDPGVRSPVPAGGADPNPAGVKGVYLPQAKAFPQANALAAKIRAAKGDIPKELISSYKNMPVKEANRFKKWAEAMGYVV